MVAMLSAERDGDVMQCNAMMGAWGGERSVVGAWKSAGWIELALSGPTSLLSPGSRSKMARPDTKTIRYLSE